VGVGTTSKATSIYTITQQKRNAARATFTN
jgi:hypothetical protein